ncbi:hypothetical protein B0H34DRAFT_358273 [Crassisporium funariophilum]|nr:hypothetical protein B0H34DRAFT_358273 [Crassisporium funariophilum]
MHQSLLATLPHFRLRSPAHRMVQALQITFNHPLQPHIMVKACVICQKTSSNPMKFLLNCVACQQSWHHRCHRPPVSDKEVIAIIHKYNAEKHQPGARLVWKCGACAKGKRRAEEQGQPAERKDTESKAAVKPLQSNEPIIVIDDDDVVVLDEPPKVPNRAVATKTTKQRQQVKGAVKSTVSSPSPALASVKNPAIAETTALSSLRKGDPVIYPLDSLPVQQHSASRAIETTASIPNKIRIIDDPFVSPPLAAPPPALPRASSSSTALVSGFIDLTVSSSDEGEAPADDDPLEYLTPPPLPAPSLPPVQPPLTQRAEPSLPAPAPAPDVAQQQIAPPILGVVSPGVQPAPVPAPRRSVLLTTWINNKHSARASQQDQEAPLDMWQRAVIRREREAPRPAPDAGGQAGDIVHGGGTTPRSTPRARRGKGRAEAGKSTVAPFFFAADVWLREKKLALNEGV